MQLKQVPQLQSGSFHANRADLKSLKSGIFFMAMGTRFHNLAPWYPMDDLSYPIILNLGKYTILLFLHRDTGCSRA